MIKKTFSAIFPILIITLVLFSSCHKIFNKGGKSGNSSHSTGWEYNNSENGNFEVSDIREQKAGPGLVFIEGGTFVMGATQEDMLNDLEQHPAPGYRSFILH